MLFGPKWSRLEIEYNGLRATIANLEKLNRSQEETIASLKGDIETVSSLGMAFKSANQAINKIDQVRSEVSWAEFLPNSASNYKVSIDHNNVEFKKYLADKLHVPEDSITEALKNSNFTILSPADAVDLSKIPPNSLWFTPSK